MQQGNLFCACDKTVIIFAGCACGFPFVYRIAGCEATWNAMS